jgi:DEAD/DEAH box helicase domain-containing protein
VGNCWGGGHHALELGIDSGGLEATILDGYPGSISSTWQQAGRSGRDTGESLSFLVAWDNPLDQYFMRHPNDFFARGFEYVLVNPENPISVKTTSSAPLGTPAGQER